MAMRRVGVGPGVKMDSQREVRKVAMLCWDGIRSPLLEGICE